MKTFMYYILAFFLLLGYYLGDALGITDWAFVQTLPVLLITLTLFYGTYIMIIDKIYRRIWK